MRITYKSLLWAVAALALIGCQRIPTTPTSIPPSPTPVEGTPAPQSTIEREGRARPPTVASEVPRITIDELKAMLSSARYVVVIDTRDRESYEAAHIRGAINVPYQEVELAAPQLPKSAKIVLYCA